MIFAHVLLVLVRTDDGGGGGGGGGGFMCSFLQSASFSSQGAPQGFHFICINCMLVSVEAARSPLSPLSVGFGKGTSISSKNKKACPSSLSLKLYKPLYNLISCLIIELYLDPHLF